MCRLLKEMSQEAVLDEEFQQKFWQIKSKFELQSVQVYRLLLEFKTAHDQAPFLSQLLLRIDYNGYFTELSEPVE